MQYCRRKEGKEGGKGGGGGRKGVKVVGRRKVGWKGIKGVV